MASPDGPLHSIGAVAQATGITPETLRVWERRYGRPEAARLPSGHRRYTQAQVTWLRRVAEALALGHRPLHVLALDQEGLDALLAAQRDDVPPDPAIERLLAYAREFRGPQLRATLEARWDPEDAVGFTSGHVAPFLRAVGRCWADGQLDIRHEHFVSEVVQDTLRGLRARFDSAGDRGGVLLATLPGETHGLGLQMAALVCASLRVPHHLLGVDSPRDQIRQACIDVEATLVGISVSLCTGGVDTDRVLAALRGELPDTVRLVIGGDGARRARRGPRGVEYVASFEDWAEVVDGLLAQRG